MINRVYMLNIKSGVILVQCDIFAPPSEHSFLLGTYSFLARQGLSDFQANATMNRLVQENFMLTFGSSEHFTCIMVSRAGEHFYFIAIKTLYNH